MTVDGFKLLCFETEIEFGNGEETIMYLQYERLFGFYKRCFSLCHDVKYCGFNETIYVDPSALVEEERDDSHIRSYEGAVLQAAKQEQSQEGKMSGGLKGKQVEEVRRADRSKVYGVNHSGAVPSWSRRFENYYQYNDYRFSKAGGYGGKSQQDSKGDAGRVDVGSQRESAEKGKSVRTNQVQKALFTSEAAGSLVSVEQSSDLVVQTEATKNGEKYAVEVAGEDVLGEADPVLKTNDETGMADDT